MSEIVHKPFPSKAEEMDLQIELLQLKKAALVFRAVNHKLRQALLQLLHKKGSMTVTEIYKELGLEQSVASQHLGILRQSRLVTALRTGKHIYYSVNYQRFQEVQQHARELLA